MSAYLQNFKNKKSIEEAYECTLPKGIKILLAWYGYGSYCGSSLVIYEFDGKLYEVNASHCSCNGLEGQWVPEETTLAALKMRNYGNSDDYYSEYDGEKECNIAFHKLIKKLEKMWTLPAKAE
jgi:hypothetical protein